MEPIKLNTNPRTEKITIGQYTIRPFHLNDGTYWIEHSSGEGMQVEADALEALIEQFYADNF